MPQKERVTGPFSNFFSALPSSAIWSVMLLRVVGDMVQRGL